MQNALSWLSKLGGGGPSTPTTAGKGMIPRGRAHGGSVLAGTPYIVGERGPELFVPGRSGTIVPNGRGGGVGGTVVNVTVNGDVTGEEVVRKVHEGLQRWQRVNGSLGFA